MIVKDDTTKLGQGILGACVLLVGIAIGFAAKPETWRHDPPQAIARVEPQRGDRLPDPTA
ncbi:MAG: hypothetical protein IIC49_07675, partial [Planctomycetes bacterium]|nr:hypothetical protein [Planctomycetota bacterium]